MTRYFQLPDQSIVREDEAFGRSRDVIRVVPATVDLDADGNEHIKDPAREETAQEIHNMPAGWLASATPDDLKQWEIVELEADPRPSDLAFDVSYGPVVDGKLTWIAKARPIEPLKDTATAGIKDTARGLILNRYAEWKQLNMLARAHELHAIQTGNWRDDAGKKIAARDLTPQEAMEEVALIAAWTWVKAVRVQSDKLEAEVAGMTDGAKIIAFVPHDWPA